MLRKWNCIFARVRRNIINMYLFLWFSDSGHYPPTLTPNLYVYGATKFSSVSITESLRELMALKKLPIRVTVTKLVFIILNNILLAKII